MTLLFLSLLTIVPVTHLSSYGKLFLFPSAQTETSLAISSSLWNVARH